MKTWNWLSFVTGLVFGALLIVGIGFYMGNKTVHNNDNNVDTPGLTMLNEGEKGTVFETQGIKVMQTLNPKMALAFTEEKGKYTNEIYYNGTCVLYIASDGERLYDDQIIKIPSGKKLIQVGTYEYPTKNNIIKTVPAVLIE
ncbi:hypothetical protein [Anaerovibrio sp.]|uniref:hypothetical protein n=1 Tax=Anaerovibrio sp. TaxID=1872532 RepID=UPI0025C4DEE7|nr:hypothetical protein [Anaerovibrio sp.]MBR2142531.1 hypothetical protein [Anaerovibrio sp.]